MARERIISATATTREEAQFNESLRPERIADIVGQERIIEPLMIALKAAGQRGEPLEHVLLSGPPGLGKTTLANVIAREMESTLRVTSGPAISKPGDLMHWLTEMKRGDVLFIDEIHRLSRTVEEFLYAAMEDFRVDFTIDSGISGRTVNIALQRFTLIGATTRAGLLTAAMRDRFGLQFHFDFYSTAELTEIVRRSARKLKVKADDPALELIAARSRGTPRVANRLLKRTRDYAQVRGDGTLSKGVVEKACEILQVDAFGLDELDRSLLHAIIRTYGGGPAGIEALAATLGQERDTLEDVVEPYLLQTGFLIRTRQGRCATKAAYDHLGIPFAGPKPGTADQASLFDQE